MYFAFDSLGIWWRKEGLFKWFVLQAALLCYLSHNTISALGDSPNCSPELILKALIMFPRVSLQPEDEPKEETTPAKPIVGIIYPPPEVRNIVDKTASFVARWESLDETPEVNK